jgi:hypothetical protein
VTAPRFTVLTQKELTIDLSREAMGRIEYNLRGCKMPHAPHVECEIDNFRNTLLNLLERSEPETETSLDLVGE